MNEVSLELRKKKHRLFCLNFERHIQNFIKELQLLPRYEKIIISVSGGVDSMVLLEVLRCWDLNLEIELLHFNHGTRPLENLNEEKLILDFGKKYNVKVNIVHLNLSLTEKNFEKKAREKRRVIYGHYIKKAYWVYTAHHLNDSFEWTLMQSFKQSSIHSTLGIPVFNKGIVRPLLCVTKKQIFRYARAKNLKWLEDKSNLNEKFERNYLRKKIISLIDCKYPRSLYHYVSRQNELAKILQVHRSGNSAPLNFYEECSGALVLISDQLENYKSVIRKCLHQKSKNSRGEIERELDKLLQTHKEIIKNPKALPFKGAMNFSGGVHAFLIRDHLLIGNGESLHFYFHFDLALVRFLTMLTQIPERAYMDFFPNLLITKRKYEFKNSKFIHSLLPKTCEWLKKEGISYTFAPLLEKKRRENFILNALLLDSSLWDK